MVESKMEDSNFLIISKDPLIYKIKNDLQEKYSDDLISIYGIGSYFDENLPSDWMKNDIDIIVILRSLKKAPKLDWTNFRYEEEIINDHLLWQGFYTLDLFKNKAEFEGYSWSNYKWSLISMKYSENSKLFYGKDIRDQLPDHTAFEFNYDDILSRSFYYLEKSLKNEIESKDTQKSMRTFTKSVFKFAFYVCVYFDKDFHSTSIRKISNKIESLHKKVKFDKKLLDFLKESIYFRRKNHFEKSFSKLRYRFMLYLFSSVSRGGLHRKMNYDELKSFLRTSFKGFPYLIQNAKKIKNIYYDLEVKKEKILREG